MILHGSDGFPCPFSSWEVNIDIEVRREIEEGMTAVHVASLPLRSAAPIVSHVVDGLCHLNEGTYATCQIAKKAFEELNASIPESIKKVFHDLPWNLSVHTGIPLDETQTFVEDSIMVGLFALAGMSKIKGDPIVEPPPYLLKETYETHLYTLAHGEARTEYSNATLVFDTAMRSDNVLTVYVDGIRVGMEKYGTQTPTQGYLFDAFSLVKSMAVKKGVTKIHVQAIFANKKLLEYCKKRYKYLGEFPYIFKDIFNCGMEMPVFEIDLLAPRNIRSNGFFPVYIPPPGDRSLRFPKHVGPTWGSTPLPQKPAYLGLQMPPRIIKVKVVDPQPFVAQCGSLEELLYGIRGRLNNRAELAAAASKSAMLKTSFQNVTQLGDFIGSNGLMTIGVAAGHAYTLWSSCSTLMEGGFAVEPTVLGITAAACLICMAVDLINGDDTAEFAETLNRQFDALRRQMEQVYEVKIATYQQVVGLRQDIADLKEAYLLVCQLMKHDIRELATLEVDVATKLHTRIELMHQELAGELHDLLLEPVRQCLVRVQQAMSIPREKLVAQVAYLDRWRQNPPVKIPELAACIQSAHTVAMQRLSTQPKLPVLDALSSLQTDCSSKIDNLIARLTQSTV